MVSFLRSAVGDACKFPGALTSTVQRRGRPRRARGVTRSAHRLLVEAIGKGELSTALTSEACAFRVPHRKGSTEHHSLPALLTHEDDLP